MQLKKKLRSKLRNKKYSQIYAAKRSKTQQNTAKISKYAAKRANTQQNAAKINICIFPFKNRILPRDFNFYASLRSSAFLRSN